MSNSFKINGHDDLTVPRLNSNILTLDNIPVFPASDPTTANQGARKSYVDDTAAAEAALAFAEAGLPHEDYGVYYEDFQEVAAALASTVVAKCHWTGGGTSGTQAVIADYNGVMQLSTTDTGSRTSTLLFSNANFKIALNPVLEFRIKTNLLTNRKVEAGWYVDGNDCCLFRFDTAVNAANVYLISEKNNGGEVSTDTGVDLVADTYITGRIALGSDGVITASINGTVVAAAHAGDVRDVAFKPYFYIDNKDQAQANLLDIDYVKIIQDRE